jgi:transposase
MAIVAGFDVHRAQITLDALDTETGEVSRGRIDSAPVAIGRWVARFGDRELDVAVEACGWLFVCDALAAAGATSHLVEPVETRALRGRKRRPKTDREDARWLRELLADGRLPEAWIPPEHVRQGRSRARLRHTLIGERTQWMQRIQATLFHHGIHGTRRSCAPVRGARFLSSMRTTLPSSSRSCRGSHPRVAAHQRPSGRSRPARSDNQPSRHRPSGRGPR